MQAERELETYKRAAELELRRAEAAAITRGTCDAESRGVAELDRGGEGALWGASGGDGGGGRDSDGFDLGAVHLLLDAMRGHISRERRSLRAGIRTCRHNARPYCRARLPMCRRWRGG